MKTFILISITSIVLAVVAGIVHALNHETGSGPKDERSNIAKKDADAQFKLSTYSSGNVSTTSLGDYL